MKLVSRRPARAESPGNCAGASKTLFNLCLRCARPDSVRPGGPSAAHRLCVCLVRLLPLLCENQNNQTGRRWHQHYEVEFASQNSPFASLHPGKQILKMSFLTGVVFHVQGQGLAGEINSAISRSDDDDTAILGWCFHCFSNGFIIIFFSLICFCSTLPVITCDIANWLPSFSR